MVNLTFGSTGKLQQSSNENQRQRYLHFCYQKVKRQKLEFVIKTQLKSETQLWNYVEFQFVSQS